jgi:competence protein ComGC
LDVETNLKLAETNLKIETEYIDDKGEQEIQHSVAQDISVYLPRESKKPELNIISADQNTTSPTQGTSSTTKTSETSGQHNTIAVGGSD